MEPRRVVISGLGLVTPIGIGVEPFWSALLNKQSGIRQITTFDASGFDSQIGGEIDELKAQQFVPKSYRKSVKVMARDIVIAVAAAYEAVKDAGLKTKCIIDREEADGPSDIDSTRFGANIGAGVICADLVELGEAMASAADENGFDIRKWGSEGMTNLTPLWMLKFLPNMLSCHVTIVHDAQGASNTITCAEASSHLAIGEAYRTISRGDADLCICGGAESRISPMALYRIILLNRASTGRNDTPEAACRPFDVSRDGSVAADGGGLMILEDYDRAKARGAKIYAEVTGFGAACGTKTWREPDAEGQGIGLAVSKAMKDAQVNADDLGLIGTFGSGVPAYDLSEARGLHTALGELAGKIPAMAIKGSTGNPGAGSGAIDVAATALALKNSTIAPAINMDTVDPQCGLNIVAGDPIEMNGDTAVSVGYALNGAQAAALVLKRVEE